MTFPKTHGLVIRKNGWIENVTIEELASDPVVTKPGRIWYNSTSHLYKGSFRDPITQNIVIKAFITEGDLRSSFIELTDTPNDYGTQGQVLKSTGNSIVWGNDETTDWPHMFHGEVEPTIDIGVLGDYYLQQSNNYFYYKQICSGTSEICDNVQNVISNWDQNVELLLMSDWSNLKFRNPIDLSKNHFIVHPYSNPTKLYDSTIEHLPYTFSSFKHDSGFFYIQSKLGHSIETPLEFRKDPPWFPETNPFTFELSVFFENLVSPIRYIEVDIDWSSDNNIYIGTDNGCGCLDIFFYGRIEIYSIEFLEGSTWVDKTSDFYDARYYVDYIDNKWIVDDNYPYNDTQDTQFNLATDANYSGYRPSKMRISFEGDVSRISLYDSQSDLGYGTLYTLADSYYTPTTDKPNISIANGYQTTDDGSDSTCWCLYYNQNTNAIIFQQKSREFETTVNSTHDIKISKYKTLENNIWYKIAVSGDGSRLRLFIDGATSSTSYTRIRKINLPNTITSDKFGLLLIGSELTFGDIIGEVFNNFQGYTDQIRWTNSCLYSTSYIPVSESFSLPGTLPKQDIQNYVIKLCETSDNFISDQAGKSFVYMYGGTEPTIEKAIIGDYSLKFIEDSGVYCTYNYDMNIYLDGEITIQFSINSDFISATDKVLMSISPDTNGFYVLLNDSEVKIVGVNGWNATSVNISHWNSNEWHHIRIVFKSGRLDIYVDGIRNDIGYGQPSIDMILYDGDNLVPKDLFIGYPINNTCVYDSFVGCIDGFEWLNVALNDNNFDPSHYITKSDGECWDHIATLKGSDAQQISSILELSDTPTAYGTIDQFLAMDSSGTRLIWKNPTTPAVRFIDLTDTPNSLGTANQLIGMNSSGTAIEWKNPAALKNNIIELNDTPIGYGTPGQILAMDPIENKLIWKNEYKLNAVAPFIGDFGYYQESMDGLYWDSIEHKILVRMDITDITQNWGWEDNWLNPHPNNANWTIGYTPTMVRFTFSDSSSHRIRLSDLADATIIDQDFISGQEVSLSILTKLYYITVDVGIYDILDIEFYNNGSWESKIEVGNYWEFSAFQNQILIDNSIGPYRIYGNDPLYRQQNFIEVVGNWALFPFRPKSIRILYNDNQSHKFGIVSSSWSWRDCLDIGEFTSDSVEGYTWFNGESGKWYNIDWVGISDNDSNSIKWIEFDEGRYDVIAVEFLTEDGQVVPFIGNSTSSEDADIILASKIEELQSGLNPQAIIDLQNTDTTLINQITTLQSTDTTLLAQIAQLQTDIANISSGGGSLPTFIYNSTTASLEHIITHNLNSTNLILTTWVQQPDNTWTKDDMEHKIIDNNNISVTLAEIANIKVIIQSV